MVCLLVGLGFVTLGFTIVRVLPYAQLDSALTPEELSDKAIHDKTLALLKRASGNQWLFWVVGGLVVTAASILGLWAVQSDPEK